MLHLWSLAQKYYMPLTMMDDTTLTQEHDYFLTISIIAMPMHD